MGYLTCVSQLTTQRNITELYAKTLIKQYLTYSFREVSNLGPSFSDPSTVAVSMVMSLKLCPYYWLSLYATAMSFCG